MKALVICPIERPGFAALNELEPLSNFPLFGTTVLGLWMDHLARLGARKIRILAGIHPEQIKDSVKDGSFWGLDLEIIAGSREPSAREARLIYRPAKHSDWLQSPNDIVVADTLPGLPQGLLFTSYAHFFIAINNWIRTAAERGRVGITEVKPGVWVGLHARISPSANLIAPAWLGENVRVGRNVTVGPHAFIEDRSVIGTASEIVDSFVGPDTAVGPATRLSESLVFGNTLVNWRRNSVVKVTDPFLLCALNRPISSQIADVIGHFLRRQPAGLRALPKPIGDAEGLEEKAISLPRSAAQ